MLISDRQEIRYLPGEVGSHLPCADNYLGRSGTVVFVAIVKLENNVMD